MESFLRNFPAKKNKYKTDPAQCVYDLRSKLVFGYKPKRPRQAHTRESMLSRNVFALPQTPSVTVYNKKIEPKRKQDRKTPLSVAARECRRAAAAADNSKQTAKVSRSSTLNVS